MNDVKDMLPPFDDYEERKIKDTDKEKKEAVCYFFRPLLHKLSRSKRYVRQGRQVRMGIDAKDETQETESWESEREKRIQEKIMAARLAHLQDDE